MTNPVKSSAWASQVDAVVREYVNARINEELKPLRDDMAALRVAISRTRESLQRDMGDSAGRVSNVEDLLGMSAKRVADLAALAKKKDDDS
jgi:hypothetical protein